MNRLKPFLLLTIVSVCVSSVLSFVAHKSVKVEASTNEPDFNEVKMEKISIIKSDSQWRQELTEEQYRILRQKGTEPPFSGQYLHSHEEGVYVCAACGNELFDSKTKYESGTGWPSFWAPIAPDKIGEREDSSLWMTRTEVLCSRCGGHLGHVFDDGPKPTGLRYCINSVALKFIAEKHDDVKSVKE